VDSTVKKGVSDSCKEITFSKNNPDNLKKVLACYKNILICGIKGVGKITNTVAAIMDKSNVYYIGNPVDYEGKRRQGSYEKYLKYILTLKKDINIISDVPALFKIKDRIILIIDEIYGRSDSQLEQISRLFEMENIQIIQIVGCLKNMGKLIAKIDVIVELHHDGAFIIDKELGKAICEIFWRKQPKLY
jgi:hypothetical protein